MNYFWGKLYNLMNDYYNNNCVISRTIDYCIHTIIPQEITDNFNINIKYNEYNNILLSHQLSRDMSLYKFSIYPEPVYLYHRIINNNRIKFGKFRVIAHPEFDKRELQVDLLYESRYFLKYHFLRFMETHGFSKELNNILSIFSHDYLHYILYNLRDVNENGAVNYYNRVILYESITK
jgi:hypothetical protein